MTERFSKIGHILGHKTRLSQFKKIVFMPYIFSDHNTIKLEVNHKKKSGKTTNTWRLKNIVLKNEWVNKEIKEEIYYFFFFYMSHFFLTFIYLGPFLFLFDQTCYGFINFVNSFKEPASGFIDLFCIFWF